MLEGLSFVKQQTVRSSFSPLVFNVSILLFLSAVAANKVVRRVCGPRVTHFTCTLCRLCREKQIRAKEQLHGGHQPKAGIAFTRIQFVPFCHFGTTTGFMD